MTASRSKKRAEGMRCCLNTLWPVRPSGSLGRNQEAQIGTTLGAVEILVGAFFVRASASSLGVTMYDFKEACRVWAIEAGRRRAGEQEFRRPFESLVKGVCVRVRNAMVIDIQLLLSYSERVLILLNGMKQKKIKEVQLHRSG